MGWSVRPFRDADFPAVWALERVRDAEGYASAVTIRQAAALWPATFLVADEGGEAVGFTIGAPSSDPGVGWILRLKVCEDRRRRGCATSLLRAMFDRLADEGVRTIRLTVAPENESARSLYAGLGFTTEGSLPDYFGPGEDRLLLSRRIDPLGSQSPAGRGRSGDPGA